MTPTTAKHEFADAAGQLVAGLRSLPEFLCDLASLAAECRTCLRDLTQVERADAFVSIGAELFAALHEVNAEQRDVADQILRVLAMVAHAEQKHQRPAQPAEAA
jgi:hypothetical protein